jgi:hypothetical protein
MRSWGQEISVRKEEQRHLGLTRTRLRTNSKPLAKAAETVFSIQIHFCAATAAFQYLSIRSLLAQPNDSNLEDHNSVWSIVNPSTVLRVDMPLLSARFSMMDAFFLRPADANIKFPVCSLHPLTFPTLLNAQNLISTNPLLGLCSACNSEEPNIFCAKFVELSRLIGDRLRGGGGGVIGQRLERSLTTLCSWYIRPC